MVYQLAGFGTLNYVVPKARELGHQPGDPGADRGRIHGQPRRQFQCRADDGRDPGAADGRSTVVYGVLKLRRMQILYDLHRPPKEASAPR